MRKFFSYLNSTLTGALVKNSAIVLSGSVLSNAMAYLYHLFVGRILGPVQYGEVAALLSLLYILNVPAQVIQTVLVKYFSELKANGEFAKAKYLFLYANKFLILVCIAGAVVFLPFIGIIKDFLHIQHAIYFVWLYLILAFFFISMAGGSLFQAFQKFTLISVLTNFGMFLRLVLGIISAFFGVGAILFSNVVSNVVGYLVMILSIKSLFKEPVQKFSLDKRRILNYSIPTFIITLSVTALYSQDVLLVRHFFSATDAGIYSSLAVLGKVIFYASSALSFVIFPVVAERKILKQGYHRVLLSGLAGISLISLPLTGVYFIFPRFVVDLLFGPAFYGAEPYLGMFGLFISFFSLSSLLLTVSLASGKTSVWILALGASLGQGALIWIFHDTLSTIVFINLIVTAILFISLLLYSWYEKFRD